MNQAAPNIALVVEGYRAETASETVDLALAFGLLDIPVTVYLSAAAQAHLWPESADLLGRWQTLLDFCPAQLFYCADATGLNTVQMQRWRFPAKLLSAEEYAARIAAADRLVLG